MTSTTLAALGAGWLAFTVAAVVVVWRWL